MDELEIYKNKAMRLENALRKITDTRHRSYDSMLSIANYALEEEVRIEEAQANKACSGLAETCAKCGSPIAGDTCTLLQCVSNASR